VHAEDLLVDHRREREDVEDVLELAPQLDPIPPLACTPGLDNTPGYEKYLV